MKIATSYFYQIRHFKPWMIPVSTAMSDPVWFRPPEGQEYYIDKRGIICGLRYNPLIVQTQGTHYCPCEEKDQLHGNCPTMQEYYELLETIDFDKMIKGFNFCSNKFKDRCENHEPIIVLIVYETPQNLCSERYALQKYFTNHGWKCEELPYPIE